MLVEFTEESGTMVLVNPKHVIAVRGPDRDPEEQPDIRGFTSSLVLVTGEIVWVAGTPRDINRKLGGGR